MVDYEGYYRNQSGGGGSHFFQGTRYQRGYGLGGILKGLFRAAVPLVTKGAKTIGKQAARTGISIAGDALSGENVKLASKRRLKEAGRTLTSKALRNIGVQPPKKKKKSIKRRKQTRTGSSRLNKRRKRSFDIFDS